jgi:hypothetical protein
LPIGARPPRVVQEDLDDVLWDVEHLAAELRSVIAFEGDVGEVLDRLDSVVSKAKQDSKEGA